MDLSEIVEKMPAVAVTSCFTRRTVRRLTGVRKRPVCCVG